jgi:hypothetical protein
MLLAVALLAAGPGAARAQDTEGESFDESANGLMWGLGLFEMGIITSLLAMPASDCDGSDCGVIAVAGFTLSFVAAGVGAVIAASTGAPSDFPFVFHHTIWPGVASAALTVALKEAVDPGADEPVLLIGVPLAVSIASGIYTFVRRDEMLRNPDTAAGTHVMTWAPWSLGLLVATAVALADDDADMLIPIAGALIGLAAYGLGIGMIESEL